MGRPKKEKPNHGKYFEYKPVVDCDLQGKPIRKSFYSLESLDDAKRQSKEYIDKLKLSRQLDSVEILRDKSFSRWCDVFLSQYIKGTVKDNTYWNNYASPIENHLKPHFGAAAIDEIKPLDVKLFFQKKKDENLALGTLEKLRVCLHSIFDCAIENELCGKNPVTKRTTVSSNKKPAAKRDYSKEERDAIIKFARGHKDGLGIILMLENGFSRSELLGLTWDSIDFEEQSISIGQGLVAVKSATTNKRTLVEGEPKNQYRIRTVPLEAETVNMLKAAYKNRAKIVGGNVAKKRAGTAVIPRLVFSDAKGNAIDPDNWSRRTYKDFMDDMEAALSEDFPGIQKLTAHELRHTFSTLAQRETGDLLALMRALGHADLKMLQRTYGHVSLDQMRKALHRTTPDGDLKQG